GVAYFHMLQRTRSWDDIQRVTNQSFGLLTHHLFDTHPDDLRDALLNNSENAVHYLDELTATLQEFRQILAAKDQSALEAALIDNAEQYNIWLNHRVSGKWDDDHDAGRPSVGEMAISSLMGGFLS